MNATRAKPVAMALAVHAAMRDAREPAAREALRVVLAAWRAQLDERQRAALDELVPTDRPTPRIAAR